MSRAAAHLSTLLYLIRGRLDATHLDPLRRDDRGAAAVSYGLVVGLVAIATIVATTAFGAGLATLVGALKSKL